MSYSVGRASQGGFPLVVQTIVNQFEASMYKKIAGVIAARTPVADLNPAEAVSVLQAMPQR